MLLETLKEKAATYILQAINDRLDNHTVCELLHFAQSLGLIDSCMYGELDRARKRNMEEKT